MCIQCYSFPIITEETQTFKVVYFSNEFQSINKGNLTLTKQTLPNPT